MQKMPILFFIFSLVSCRSFHSDQLSADERAAQFLPAVSFVNSELLTIDSLPVAIFRYRTDPNGIRDTQIIAKPVFKEMMKGWFGEGFSTSPIRVTYKKKVFMDATLGKVTISFDTEEADAAIRRLDLLMDPETDAIQNLYAERVDESQGKSISQKLFWSAGRQCRISKTIIVQGVPDSSENLVYSWKFGD